MRARRVMWLTMALTVVAAATMASAAEAAKVANPGNVTFTIDSGFLRIKQESWDAASSDDPAIARGTVTAGGALTINSFDFPDLEPIDGPFGQINVTINVIGTPSGNVNPITGAMNLNATVRVDADGGGVGSDCHVGPIHLSLITGTTNPPGPNSPITGSPYNTSNGRVSLVDNSFSVPGASGCSTFPVNVNNEINSRLHLPSASGNNEVRLNAFSTPILASAIQPSFTATPSSGPAPLPVSFDASATFHTRPITSYEWDFDGNGIFDATTAGPTTSTTYPTSGTRTVRLRVTDADGDTNTTTRQVVVGPPIPDLSIAKSHSGDFVTGIIGTYLIDVTNTGAATSTGTITVSDTLPDGMTFNAARGDNWACSAAGQLVTCTNPGPITANGGTLDQLELDVDVASPAVGLPTNTASVSTPGDSNLTNNSASDPTRVFQGGIDLRMTKDLADGDSLLRGRRATYVLSVDNVGTTATTERIRVVDQIPAGLSIVSASGGLAWVCSVVVQEVRCFSDEVADSGEILPPINIRVEVAPDAPDSITNSATVTTAGDAIVGNNTGTHTGTVEGYATDYALAKTHDGEFIVGEPGFYRLTVTNVGTATGDNQVTVLDQLPPGMTLDGYVGDGWSCGSAGQNVSCLHAGNVEPGDQLPVLTLRVDSSAVGAGQVTNTAAVMSEDDFNVENDVATDPTDVRLPRPDLTIAKSHEGNFVGGSTGSYLIEVRNISDERADGPTSVTDTLPAGMSFAGASGAGWSCLASGQEVTCDNADPIAGGAVSALQIEVAVAREAAGEVLTNVAEVANAADTIASNNRAEDPTLIEVPVAAPTTIEAQGIVFSYRKGQDPKILPWVSATLTSGGEPVAGKTIQFTQHIGGSFRNICTATTGADGIATCQITVQVALDALLSGGRYFAYWVGDDDYAPATDQGALINLLGLRLI